MKEFFLYGILANEAITGKVADYTADAMRKDFGEQRGIYKYATVDSTIMIDWSKVHVMFIDDVKNNEEKQIGFQR